MTLLKATDYGYGYYTPSPLAITQAIVFCFLEIVLPLLAILDSIRAGSLITRVKTEIGRFIKSFVVVVVVLNILWLMLWPVYPTYIGTRSAVFAAAAMVSVACIAEIAVSLLLNYWRYGESWNEETNVRTGVTRFIIIFVAVFAIVNAVWIGLWVIGWF